MNTIMKLIRVDLLKLDAIKGMMAMSFVMCFLFSFMPWVNGLASVFFLYAWVYTPMAYDEANKGEALLWGLPVSRRQIVQAKYLYVLIGVVIACVFQFIGNYIMVSIILPSNLPILTTGIFVSLMLPCLLYLGVTKGRYVVMVLYIVFVVLAGMGTSLIREIVTPYFQPSLPLVILLVAVLLTASYLVSVRLYEKRELE